LCWRWRVPAHRHHGSWPQAFGYRIDTPDRSIVISGDCSPSPAELAQIAAKTKPKLLVLYHQLIRGTTDQALLKGVRKDYRGRVVSAHDLDLY
jgi:ribonuclease BN (tRNA processing enzyme)